jgi:acyl carrier protein
MDVQQQIRIFIGENFLFNRNGFNSGDDASFLETGIINSLGVMELVQFVEEQFGIPVADEDVVPANFDSVNRLAAFIEARKPVIG